MNGNATLLQQAPVMNAETQERYRRLGEAFAEVLRTDMQMPSFMRMAVEHQKEHPEKTPMQCLSAVREPYLKMHHEAVVGIAERACSKDCK